MGVFYAILAKLFLKLFSQKVYFYYLCGGIIFK